MFLDRAIVLINRDRGLQENAFRRFTLSKHKKHLGDTDHEQHFKGETSWGEWAKVWYLTVLPSVSERSFVAYD